MKFARMMCVCAAVAALSMVPAMGSVSTATTTNVPFEFVAGGKTLPAGEYVISAPDAAGKVQIVGHSRGASAVVVGNRVGPQIGEPKPRLVFMKSAGKYRLAEVWGNANPGGIAVGSK